jgi:hypothetical protein
MEAYDVLVMAMSSLIMLIVIHVSVFAVVRWMYPPMPVQQVRFAEPVAQAPPFTQSSTLPFTQPAQMKQEVNVPTYAPPVSMEAPGEERQPNPAAKPEGSSAERPAWLVAVDPKTLE